MCVFFLVLLFKCFAHSAVPHLEACRLAGMEDWGKGKFGLENWSLGVQNDAWDLLIWGPNRGLEGPDTSKIGSWTVWKAVWRARGSSGRPSWGSKGRFGRHLGATWAPREAFWERFWRILGSQTGPETRFFGSKLESAK